MENATMPEPSLATAHPETVVVEWLKRFESALGQEDASAAMALLSAEPMWRDIYALTWDITPARGREGVRRFLEEYAKPRKLSNLAVSHDLRIDADDAGVITSLFTFRTDVGLGRGVLRLKNEDGTYVGWSVSTELRDLIDDPRPVVSVADAASEEYTVLLKDTTAGMHVVDDYEDHEPEVLIVGGGHSGLILAARLGQEGVDTLVVDDRPRAGDNWRERYESLRLHDTKWFAELPYLPFPPSWPLFSTKDGMGNWLELFSTALDINLWNSSTVVKASYDAAAKQWEVTIQRDGEQRTVRPGQLVFATGLNGLPAIPSIPGIEDFQGFVTHSSTYMGPQEFPGKRVLVVGTGSSGLDIAKDAFHKGCDVTLLQRGPCNVVSTKYGIPAIFGASFSETSPPPEISDSLAASLPMSFIFDEVSPVATRALAERDKEMLDGLESVGFRTTLGPGERGQVFIALSKGGSYYIDNGAADLIISKKIALAHGSISRFTPTGVVLEDGTELEFDAVVFATGFANMRESIKPIVGEEVASQVASVWGLDESGELRTTFRHTGHERLWICAHGVANVRMYSGPLAVMIKAVQRGVVSDEINVKLKSGEPAMGDYTYKPAGRLAN